MDDYEIEFSFRPQFDSLGEDIDIKYNLMSHTIPYVSVSVSKSYRLFQESLYVQVKVSVQEKGLLDSSSGPGEDLRMNSVRLNFINSSISCKSSKEISNVAASQVIIGINSCQILILVDGQL